jgi:hypothetical protein
MVIFTKEGRCIACANAMRGGRRIRRHPLPGLADFRIDT